MAGEYCKKLNGGVRARAEVFGVGLTSQKRRRGAALHRAPALLQLFVDAGLIGT
jgi:hypothetical protein